MSKEHCHVDLIDGRWRLKDLGSLNGTYVNGERITERVLAHGDEIALGSTRIVFEAEDAQAGSVQSMPAMPASAPPASPQAPPPARPGSSKVTIAPGMVESHIRTKLQPLLEQNFLSRSVWSPMPRLCVATTKNCELATR